MPRQMPASQPRFMWAVLMLLSCPRYLAVSSVVLLVGWVWGGLGLAGQKVVYCMESTVIVLSPTLT